MPRPTRSVSDGHGHVPRKAHVDLVGKACDWVCTQCLMAVKPCACQDKEDDDPHCRECRGTGWVLQ